jgi:hypothetical protein
MLAERQIRFAAGFIVIIMIGPAPAPAARGNDVGACCLEGQVCKLLREGDCLARGGTFLGRRTDCDNRHCPPDCENALYQTSPPNGVAAIRNMRTLSGEDRDGEVVCDIRLMWESSLITSVHWFQGDSKAFDFAGSAQLTIYAADPTDDLNRPTEIVVQLDEIPADRFDSGEALAGRRVWYYKLQGVGVELPTGLYWFGIRPNRASDAGESFWMSADPIGRTSYFRSWFEEYEEFTDIADVIGQPQDFSFCIGGQATGEATGACCFGDECRQLTQAACAEQGGRFRGEGSECWSDRCLGVCCLWTPECVELSPAHCAAAGGVHLGVELRCEMGPCWSRSVYCDDALMSQFGEFSQYAPLSQDNATTGIASWAMDEWVVEQRVTLDRILWTSFESPLVQAESAEFAIWYASPDCTATEVVAAAADDVSINQRLPLRTVTMYWEGEYEDARGFFNEIVIQPVTLVPGTYHVGVRINCRGEGRVYAGLIERSGCDGRYWSPDLGVDHPRPLVELINYYGGLEICLSGAEGGAEVGACCLKESCSLLTEAECMETGGSFHGVDARCYPTPCGAGPGACCFGSEGLCEVSASQATCQDRGGVFAGVDTVCLPNPCAGASGACCFDRGSCEVLRPEECAGLGGSFGGGDVGCWPGVCVFPDVCAESQYDNGKYDGLNGIWTYRFDGELEFTVDDVAFARDEIITQITWYALEGFSAPIAGDLRIYQAGELEPGTQVAEVLDHPLDRAPTGDELYGRLVYVYSMRDLEVPVSEGVFYVGPVPVMAEYSFVYILTAPPSGRKSYLHTSWFHCYPWCKVETYFGIDVNLSMCLTTVPCRPESGDSNCDGSIDFEDIDCFVRALQGEGAWEGCCGEGFTYLCANDVDNSGKVDFEDVDPFVQLLVK